MVQEDNKFKMLINISALCDDTWISRAFEMAVSWGLSRNKRPRRGGVDLSLH